MFRTIFDLFKFIFKKVTKLSIPYFSVEENDLKFKISTDSYYKYTLYNIVIKVRHDPYVYEAYTLKANNIFLENIHTHYEFNIYRVNNEFNLYLIYIYEMNKEIFIVDSKGELYENLLRNFEKSYNCNFEKNENNHFDLNISLVKKNALNNYFKLASS